MIHCLQRYHALTTSQGHICDGSSPFEHLASPIAALLTFAQCQAHLLCSIFFVSGLNTLFSTILGSRLPIIQGGSFSFIVPAFAIIANVASRPELSDCPAEGECDARFRVRTEAGAEDSVHAA